MNIHISKCICLLLCFLHLCTLDAQNYYVSYSPEARKIYKNIIDLKLDSIPDQLETFKLQEPYNLASLHLENYLDFFTIFINEEEWDFDQRSKNKTKRLSIVEKNLDDSNPYKRFIKAEINLQWALTRSKFNQLFKSGREVYKAYNLLTENQRLFPDFIYNKKSLSILHALVETISIANIFKSILGLDGSIELAKVEIDSVIEFAGNNKFIFKEEADALKALILFYQANEKEEAWAFIQKSSLDIDESLLSVFLVSKLAQRIGENEKAIDILKNRPQSQSYSDFAYLDYQIGLSLLRKLDPKCTFYLKQFVETFKGKHFVKEAYQKLAWASWIFDKDANMYEFYMSKVKTEGDVLVDDDRQALQESNNSNIPNEFLLRSRLLFDGGYFQQSLEMLTDNNSLILSDKKLFVEFNYRKARVLQHLKQFDKAQKYFDYLIKNHAKDNEFYACNAALQMGLIMEELNDIDTAKLYFKKCLNIKPKSYKRSLHQKAKSGLERHKKEISP